ncbi:MAG: hypothetical protein LC114_26565, partial [Bryobacterales bacterium]|nr:hypothetical protein [Bryobacterales bacterium]
IPELNDEFAQDMGDYKTADDLRAGVRRAIQEEREYIGRERAKQAIAQSLGESYTFPVPEVYVNQHLESSIRRQMRNLVMQGVNVETAGIDWQKVIDEEREPATKSVRAYLVIERIAAAESISVTEQEVNDEVARIARRERIAPAALRERMAKDGGLDQLAQRIETDKVLDLLFERATKVPPPPPAEEPAAEPEASETES